MYVFFHFFVCLQCKTASFTLMKSVKAFILTYVLWLLLGTASKVVFLLTYHELFEGLTLADVMGVVGHGVKLDMAIASYLTVLPALVLFLGIWNMAEGEICACGVENAHGTSNICCNSVLCRKPRTVWILGFPA